MRCQASGKTFVSEADISCIKTGHIKPARRAPGGQKAGIQGNKILALFLLHPS
jgi:hypothetical protein